MARVDVLALEVHAEHRLLDPEVVHLAEHDGHRVGRLVDVLGHALEHVLDRELHLLGLVVHEPGAEEAVPVLLVALGDPHHEVDDTDVGREGHGARLEHVLVLGEPPAARVRAPWTSD